MRIDPNRIPGFNHNEATSRLQNTSDQRICYALTDATEPIPDFYSGVVEPRNFVWLAGWAHQYAFCWFAVEPFIPHNTELWVQLSRAYDAARNFIQEMELCD